MLFNGAERFRGKTTTHPNGDLLVYRSDKEDTDHVGPGVYWNSQEEERRNGWIKKRHTNREPMARPSREVDRSHHYTNGELIGIGMAIAGSPDLQSSPGPGHYSPAITGTLLHKSPNKKLNVTTTSAHNSSMQSATHLMGTSPRLSPMKAVVRNGVYFASNEDPSSSPGPGHYLSPSSQSNLIKKSHNVRASPDHKAKLSPRPRSQGGSPFSPQLQRQAGLSRPSPSGSTRAYDDSFRTMQ